MPKLSLKNKELVDKLFNKINNDPFTFTVLNHFELEASESNEELDDMLVDVTLKEYINNLQDKDQSIVLYRESHIMHLILDHLSLFSRIKFKKIPSTSRSINIFESSSEGINFTILHHDGAELWIFSKQEVDKLKIMIKDTILSRVLVDIDSLKPGEMTSLSTLIVSILN